MIAGGIASNVIPGTAACEVNFRYAPGRSPEEAEARLRGAVRRHGELVVTSNAPSGPVPLDNPHVDRLRSRPRGAPKQAWTPVAEFGRAGVDAINFGPGEPAQAHQRDEHVRGRRARRGLPRAGGVRLVRLSPVLDRAATYPFVRLDEAKRELPRRGVDVVDFGIGEPREETPALHPRGAGGGDRADVGLSRRPTGCPELRAAIAALGRRAASASRWTRTPRSCRRSAPRRRSSTSPRSSAASSSRSPRRPTRSPSAARCSPAARCWSCRCWRERLPARPRRGRRRDVGAGRPCCG